MGPKFDPNEVIENILRKIPINKFHKKALPKILYLQVKFIYLRAVGGEVGAASSLAPKVIREKLSLIVGIISILFSGRSSRSFAQESWR